MSPNLPILTLSSLLNSSGSFIISGLLAISSSRVPYSVWPEEMGAVFLTVLSANLGLDETFGGSDVIVEADPLYWPLKDPLLTGLADCLLDVAELSRSLGLFLST